MWSPETSQGYEASKCRHRVVSFCRGVGLDIGCGSEKIVPSAIGVDMYGKEADINVDMNAINPLQIFTDGFFDYVFSSHCLEDFKCTDGVLREWWRVIKPGGYLILYGPDPDYYPRIGTPGANPTHERDLYWQDVWKILKGFGNAKRISASRHNDSNEYSWLLVTQKRMAFLKTKPLDTLMSTLKKGCIAFPFAKRTNKQCLIIRYGAFGDILWSTPVLRELKKEGYYVVYNCTERSAPVLRECPWVDEFLIQGNDDIPNEDLGDYWKTIGRDFDRVINFSQSVERSLLKAEGTPEFMWSHNKRHRECNVNYQDQTMKWAGYPRLKGELPIMHFSEWEEQLGGIFRRSFKDKFLIVWSLAGSSYHKIYPWANYVADRIAKEHKDTVIVTVGDYICKVLEWDNDITIRRSGEFTIRQSMILTKYADLVLGTETGILNAAACYDTPKIVLLSHSSVENLTKHWKNCTSLSPAHSRCKCYPCHQLHYSRASCPCGMVERRATLCMENIKPETVYAAFEKYHRKWEKEQKDGDRQK